MPSSSSRFFSTNVVLRCLAEQADRNTLAALCLVNKHLNAECTPVLYAEIQFGSRYQNSDCELLHQRLKDLSSSNPNLKYTKLVKLWKSLLEQAPMLETFEFIDAPLSNTSLRTLGRCCPRLKHLSILYSSVPYEIDHDGPLYRCVQNFSGITDLTTLSLEGLYGEALRMGWHTSILSLLRASPSLRHLSLGLEGHDGLGAEPPDHPNLLDWRFFFQNLCRAYGDTGSQPLSLQTLRLGLGMLLWGDDEAPPKTLEAHRARSYFHERPPAYLLKLTNLEHLEEVHMHNADHHAVRRRPQDFRLEGWLGLRTRSEQQWGDYTTVWVHKQEPLAWGAFTPEYAPRLRKLTCQVCTPTFIATLQAMDPTFAAGLTVSHHESFFWTILPVERDDFVLVSPLTSWDPAWGGPFGYRSLTTPSSDGTGPRSSLGFRIMRFELHAELKAELDHAQRDADRILEEFVAAQAATLEGLSIDNGFRYARNGLGPYLARLPKLTQLLVEKAPLQSDAELADAQYHIGVSQPRVPWKEFDPLEDHEEYQKCREEAVALVSCSTSIRFIKEGRLAFRVVRFGESPADFHLLDMDLDEEAAVEVFRL